MTKGRWAMVGFVIFGVFFPMPFLTIMAIGITLAVMFALLYPFYLVWMFLGVDNREDPWYITGTSPYPKGSIGYTELRGQ